MKGVAIYARYSSDGQRETSIEDQIRECREYAEIEGYRVLDDQIYADYAISGRNPNRPELKRMMEASQRLEFDAILIFNLARLARDNFEIHRIINILEYLAVDLILVSEKVKLSDFSVVKPILEAISSIDLEEPAFASNSFINASAFLSRIALAVTSSFTSSNGAIPFSLIATKLATTNLSLNSNTGEMSPFFAL